MNKLLQVNPAIPTEEHAGAAAARFMNKLLQVRLSGISSTAEEAAAARFMNKLLQAETGSRVRFAAKGLQQQGS